MAERDDQAEVAVPGTGGETGATRGTGGRDDPGLAGGGDGRAAPSTEYTANTDPEPEDVAAGGPPRAADLDPHEAPGQG